MRVRSDPKDEVAASHTNDITEKGGGFQRCRFVGRSNNNANANGGLVYANANNGSANSNTNIGSRLANNKNKNFNKIAPTETKTEPDSIMMTILRVCSRYCSSNIWGFHLTISRR